VSFINTPDYSLKKNNFNFQAVRLCLGAEEGTDRLVIYDALNRFSKHPSNREDFNMGMIYLIGQRNRVGNKQVIYSLNLRIE